MEEKKKLVLQIDLTQMFDENIGLDDVKQIFEALKENCSDMDPIIVPDIFSNPRVKSKEELIADIRLMIESYTQLLKDLTGEDNESEG